MIIFFTLYFITIRAEWLPWSKCLKGTDPEKTVAACGTNVFVMDQSDGRKFRSHTDGRTETVFCGFTPCNVYTNQLLSESDMDSNENWICNNCNLETDTDRLSFEKLYIFYI